MFLDLHNKKTFHKGGVHPPEEKLSQYSAIESIPLPKQAIIPISQHIGAPAEIAVKKGDQVKVGDILATHKGFVSSNVHASVSGKVRKIDEAMDSSGFKKMAVTIQVNGDEWNESIDRSEKLEKDITLSSKEIINKVMEAGVVGQGGAAFPSHVKLSVPEGKHVDTVIINGVECEPYLTADHRLMVEKPHQIMVGTKILMRTLNVCRAIIGIEDNKQDAIELLKEIAGLYEGISVESLKVQYPQGGEKQLIEALLGREVPSGGLPADVGAIVHNVGTTYSIYQAVQKNQPLIERVVTITGKSLEKPSNLMVRIGTPVIELIAAAGGIPKDTGKVISGGPMMGKAISDLSVPIAKATSGILLIPDVESKRSEEYNCLRCGKCIEVCPMGLEPYYLMMMGQLKDTEKAEQEYILDCIECGSCSFVCPSNRPILDYIRLGKYQVKKTKAT